MLYWTGCRLIRHLHSGLTLGRPATQTAPVQIPACWLAAATFFLAAIP